MFGGDAVGEVFGIVAGTVDERRVATTLEAQADGVETGHLSDATAVRDPAILVQDGNGQPGV